MQHSVSMECPESGSLLEELRDELNELKELVAKRLEETFLESKEQPSACASCEVV